MSVYVSLTSQLKKPLKMAAWSPLLCYNVISLPIVPCCNLQSRTCSLSPLDPSLPFLPPSPSLPLGSTLSLSPSPLPISSHSPMQPWNGVNGGAGESAVRPAKEVCAHGGGSAWVEMLVVGESLSRKSATSTSPVVSRLNILFRPATFALSASY